jgi:hypothetical protein
MSEKPEEPNFDALEDELDFSPLDEEAVHMHELYKSLIKAGFRERQSLLLVAMIVNDAHEEAVFIQSMEQEEGEENDPDFPDEDLAPDN